MEESTSSAPPPQIFVSYSSRDAGSLAGELRAILDAAGYEATGDWDVQAGENWAEVLERLRHQAAAAVVLITPVSLASEPISLEARAFYQRASTEPGFILIPLLADGVDLTALAASRLGWLAEFQIPTGDTFAERVQGAIVSLGRLQRPGGRPGEERAAAPPRPDDPASAPVLTTISMIDVKAPVGALALGRLEGERIAVTGDEYGAVRVWDLATGDPRGDPLLGHSGAVWSVALGQLDGRLVAVTGGADGVIRFWDLAGGRMLTSPGEGHSALVNSVATGSSADRLIAVSASDDQTVRVWDVASGQPVATMTGHTDWVNSVAMGVLDGRPVVVSGSADQTVRVWDLTTGELIMTMIGHTDSVSSVAVGVLDGRPVVVSSSADQTVRVWGLPNGDPIVTLTGHVGRVRTVAYGAVGGRPSAISGGDDRTVRVWDLIGAAPGAPLTGHTGPVRAVAFTDVEGQPSVLVSGSDDGTVRIWGGAPDKLPPRDQVEWLSDSPSDQDLLRRRPLAQAIAVRLERFQREDPGTSFLVHIDGPWGTGKSTLVNLLRSELKRDWLAVDFNAWRQSRIGPPWWALLAALRHDLGRDLKLPARIRLRLTESWARSRRGGAPFVFALILLVAVAAAVLVLLGPRRLTLTSAAGTAQAVTAIVTAVAAVWAGALVAGRFLLWDSARGARVFEQSNTNPMQDVADHFGWLVMKAKRPVVFFVDDLDRCTETYVVDFLDAVQTLVRDAGTRPDGIPGHAPAASFVIAADGSWLRKSYEIAFDKFVPSVAEPGRPLGYLFLDKLFQLRVPVPAIGALRRQEFLGDILGVHGVTQASRPATAEEQSVRASLRQSSTEAEVLGALRRATPEIRDRVAVAALNKLTTPEVTAATEHSLQRFGPLLAPNPRSMKRFVNDYSILRAIRTLEGNPISSEPLALWAIIETQWPALADYLRASPDAIGLVGKPAAELEAVPSDLRSLFSDPAVRRLADFEHGGPLTSELIGSCCGA